MRICGQNPRTNADATFQDPVLEQQRSVHSISSHHDVTKVVILGIEYRYQSLSSIEYRHYRWYRPNPIDFLMILKVRELLVSGKWSLCHHSIAAVGGVLEITWWSS